MIYTMRTFPVEVPLPEADVCLLGIPWDSSEIGASVKYGPLFIRQALKEIEGFDPQTGKDVFDGSQFCDMGDVDIVPANWSLTKGRIVDTLEHLRKINDQAFPVILGGDHLITLGILETLPKDVTIVHFDAHADLSKDWLGEPFSHISWGYHAIQRGHKLAQVGIRSMTKDEHVFIEGNKQHFLSLDEIEGPVYLTMDLDVFDPGFAPEVGTPEPLGMTPQDVFAQIKKACRHEIIGMDVVECASTKVGTPTALLAAQVIKKVLLWKNK